MRKPEKSKATDAPMCKLCKTRHWMREPHKFAPKKKKPRVSRK